MTLAQIIKDYWSLIVIVGGFVISLAAALRYRIPAITKQIEKLEEGQRAMSGTLTREVNRLETACGDKQRICRSELCGKIDLLRVDFKQFGDRANTERTLLVTREDFRSYKREMNAHIASIFELLKQHAVLQARIDERVSNLVEILKTRPAAKQNDD